MPSTPRIAFVTVVELGERCLEVIRNAGGELVAMLTLHDELARKKSGRVFLDEFSASTGWPLHKIRHINDASTISLLRALNLDWLFIIGWSQIASLEALSTARRGAIGMHPTLLPQGRGRAAIPWAIIKGLPETGVTAFRLAEGVDTGELLGAVRIPIAERETATSLYARVAHAHEQLIADLWPRLIEDRVVAQPQDENGASYWPGRTPADGEITPAMPLTAVDRLVRATTRPYPGAFVRTREGVIRIWSGIPTSRMSAGDRAIPCADGTFYATEFELEPDDT